MLWATCVVVSYFSPSPPNRSHPSSHISFISSPPPLSPLSPNTSTPNGLEALIRWNYPVRGIVQPDDFIPLLEETGLMIEALTE
jgi:hypothetical protein